MQTFIPFQEARRIVLENIRRLDVETVQFRQALGRVLAEPVISREMIPPFDNSAMDGYAVRSSDVVDPDRELPLAGTIAAGSGRPPALAEGSCAAIMTGAPIPDGADAVIPVEKAVRRDHRVRFSVRANAGDNVRRAGANVKTGDCVVESGTRVTPPVIGMLATLGMTEVRVYRHPRVAVIATGDEIVDASQTPEPSQIRDSNGPTLAAQIALAGGTVDGPHRVGDDRRRLDDALAAAAAAADVLVVSGGVSMGEYDYVREALESVGLEPIFWKVRQRPGKPLFFGLIGRLPVFGLPGNPVSASVCFEQYVRPALSGMQGLAEPTPYLEKAILDERIDAKGGLHHFIRGRLRYDDDRLHVAPTGPQGSHISVSLVKADCFIHVPEDVECAEKGSVVDVERLGW